MTDWADEKGRQLAIAIGAGLAIGSAEMIATSLRKAEARGIRRAAEATRSVPLERIDRIAVKSAVLALLDAPAVQPERSCRTCRWAADEGEDCDESSGGACDTPDLALHQPREVTP